MFGKTILASFLSFVLVLVLAMLLEPQSTFARNDLNYFSFFVMGLFYGFPMLAIGFGVLYCLNLIIRSILRKRSARWISLRYFLLGIVMASVPVSGFILFDYSQREREFKPSAFDAIIAAYFPAYLLVITGLLLNWIIVWKCFRGVSKN